MKFEGGVPIGFWRSIGSGPVGFSIRFQRSPDVGSTESSWRPDGVQAKFRGWPNEVLAPFENKKLKIEKWFTVFKNINYFTEIK